MAELLAVGETMLALIPDTDSASGNAHYRVAIAGGESNVAVHVAAHGRESAWLSRVGADDPGRRILAELRARGVDVSGVEVDQDAPTGLMLKEQADGRTRVVYHRAGSAASRITPDLVSDESLAGVRIVHVTGVTPVLSESCAAAVDAIFGVARRVGARVSFDVNHRPRLWAARPAADVLHDYAEQADICFVGRDEAEALWGTTTPQSIRDRFPDVPLLVVKDAEHGATAYDADRAVFVPAQEVEVVEPVGAGDAFAGGFLAGQLAGSPLDACLELGHATARTVLRTMDDLPSLEAQ